MSTDAVSGATMNFLVLRGFAGTDPCRPVLIRADRSQSMPIGSDQSRNLTSVSLCHRTEQRTSNFPNTAAAEEPSRFDNVCLCIAPRITIVTSDCGTLRIPTFSVGAARNTSCRMDKDGERLDSLGSNVWECLGFHPSCYRFQAVSHLRSTDPACFTIPTVCYFSLFVRSQKTTLLRLEHRGASANRHHSI